MLRRKDHRIVIHFDYDCFYASVFEAENPALKGLPLAVQQKQIIVTCNYEARRRGLRKLQLIKEARRVCPEVVVVLGEDLTRFRNASKALCTFLASFSWDGKVDRLGFDEVFMDVTSIIDFNERLVNDNLPRLSFFCLKKDDPAAGFPFDASQVAGHVYGEKNEDPTLLNNLGESVEDLAQKLVSQYLISLFRRLHPEKSGWDLSLINIAVTNIVETAGMATGRDISKMFKNQDTNLKEWRVDDVDVPPDQEMEDISRTGSPSHLLERSRGSEDQVPLSQASQSSYFQGGWDEEDEDAGESLDLTCPFCQAKMPSFAIAAHMRFHETED